MENTAEILKVGLSFKNLDESQLDQVSKALNCSAGGVNPRTLLRYFNFQLETDSDWSQAREFMNKFGAEFKDISISYSALTKLSWGEFDVSKQAIDFVSEYGCTLSVSFMTPPNNEL